MTQNFENSLFEKLQFGLLIIAMVISTIIIFQYTKGVLNLEKTLFLFSLVATFFFLFEIIISIVSGVSVAKGILIKRATLPFLYSVSLGASIILLLLSISGVIYYY